MPRRLPSASFDPLALRIDFPAGAATGIAGQNLWWIMGPTKKTTEAGAVPPLDGPKWTRALKLGRQKARKAHRQIGGDPDRARHLLWQWARQDRALKDAIFRVGCHHLTMGAIPSPEPAGGAA